MRAQSPLLALLVFSLAILTACQPMQTPTPPETDALAPTGTPTPARLSTTPSGTPWPTLAFPTNLPELMLTPINSNTLYVHIGPQNYIPTSWLGEVLTLRFLEDEVTWQVESYTEGMVLVSASELPPGQNAVFFMRATGQQTVVFRSQEPTCPSTPVPPFAPDFTPPPPCTPAPQRIEASFDVKVPTYPPTPIPPTPYPTVAVDVPLYNGYVQMYVGQTFGFTEVKRRAGEHFWMGIDTNLFEVVSYPDQATYDQAPIGSTFPIIFRAIASGAAKMVIYQEKCDATGECGMVVESPLYFEIYPVGMPFATPWWYFRETP